MSSDSGDDIFITQNTFSQICSDEDKEGFDIFDDDKQKTNPIPDNIVPSDILEEEEQKNWILF